LLDEEGKWGHIIANVRDISHEREAEELKNTLLSVISHELKTPVSIIKGYAGTLAREDAHWDKPTFADGLTVIEEEADKLNNLINNLLDASRLQAGGLKLQFTDLDLPVLAKKAVEHFSSTTDKHTFQLNFPASFPAIQGDQERMSEVFTNLIGNAIKYSPDGGKITISGDFDKISITIHISDQGIGIPEAEQEAIFDRFHRVDSGLTRQTPGAGLGLYLAKSVIEAHGGSIRVESHAGKGSTFIFKLPTD
jgi:signal transduction histidine kinase